MNSWQWHCEPARWSYDAAAGVLTIAPDANTDFWQRTHYGFRADNGHFRYTVWDGDFVLSVRVRFRTAHKYDQAGLMVRFSEDCWLKTSVEHQPGGPNLLGAVVTNGGYSDWSFQSYEASRGEVWLQVQRLGADYEIGYSIHGREWTGIRVAHLFVETRSVQAGVYACAPQGGGFLAFFEQIEIRAKSAIA